MSVKLPQVYATSYSFCLNVLNRTRQFPKHYRPTLGRKLEEAAINLSMDLRSMLLTKSIHDEKKRSYLSRLIKCVDDLKFMIQICFDLKVLSPAGYGELNEQLSSVGRQLGGIQKNGIKKLE